LTVIQATVYVKSAQIAYRTEMNALCAGSLYATLFTQPNNLANVLKRGEIVSFVQNRTAMEVRNKLVALKNGGGQNNNELQRLKAERDGMDCVLTFSIAVYLLLLSTIFRASKKI